MFDLIRDRDENYIKLGSLSKMDIGKLLNKYGQYLSEEYKEQLMFLFEFNGTEFVSNRDLKKLYSLLNILEIKQASEKVFDKNSKRSRRLKTGLEI